MWSSSPGGLCRSASAPRDPLCDSQDLCHCPHSTPNNFCCGFSVSIVCGHFCLNKSTLHYSIFCRCCMETEIGLCLVFFPSYDIINMSLCIHSDIYNHVLTHPDIYFTDILFCALWEIFYPSYIYFSKTIASQTKLPLAVYTIILAWGNKIFETK